MWRIRNSRLENHRISRRKTYISTQGWRFDGGDGTHCYELNISNSNKLIIYIRSFRFMLYITQNSLPLGIPRLCVFWLPIPKTNLTMNSVSFPNLWQRKKYHFFTLQREILLKRKRLTSPSLSSTAVLLKIIWLPLKVFRKLRTFECAAG